MDSLKKLQDQWRWRRQQKQHRLAQGGLTTREAAVQLSAKGHLPLAALPGYPDGPFLSIPTDVDGHLLLVAPPDSRWQEHLVMTLLNWPAAVLVVDPAGKLYQRTGYLREMNWGKVYTIPGYRFNLARYFRFWETDAARRLHSFLIQESPPVEDWLLDHSVSLLQALGCYSRHYKNNPLQLLLDAAYTDLRYLLAALDSTPGAGLLADCFAMGLPAEEMFDDPDVHQSFARFSEQLMPYQPLYGSFTGERGNNILPGDWVENKGSLYLTFPPEQMTGLAAALVDGIGRYHQTYGGYQELLLVMDAAFARRLSPIEPMLVELAGYNVTILLTAESLSALTALASDGDGAALASRFAHQVWYPPHDRQTAEHIAWLYGTELMRPDSSLVEPVLSTEAILAWPTEQVLVYTRRERPYRFLAERVTVPADMVVKPAPVPPQPITSPRKPRAWLPLEVLLMDFSPRQRLQSFRLEAIPARVDKKPKGEVKNPAQLPEPAQATKPAADEGIQPSLPLFASEEEEQAVASAEPPVSSPHPAKPSWH